jgi:uncharacterized membrane protein (UPF0127 family)
MEETRLTNLRSGAVLAESVAFAHDSASRRKGWLGRTSAPAGEAMWIEPCEAVHCFFMRFPIDVLFLDRDLQVISLRRAVRPWRIAVCLRAHMVIELPEGTIDATGTVAGDRLAVHKPAGSKP